MQEAVIAFIVLAVGTIVGLSLKPTEAELRPLWPEAGAAQEDHGHHH